RAAGSYPGGSRVSYPAPLLGPLARTRGGRGATPDWALPPPDRLLGGSHARAGRGPRAARVARGLDGARDRQRRRRCPHALAELAGVRLADREHRRRGADAVE